MTDAAAPAAVEAAVSRLFGDDALQRKDRYGFSPFDVLLAQLRGLCDIDASTAAIVNSLIEQINEAAADETRWSKVKDVVSGLGIQSKDLAHAIEVALSGPEGPQGAWARYWAYFALKTVGGNLRTRQLINETILREELTPLWLDLFSEAAAGAPLSIIQAYCTELSRTGAKLDWKDVRRRIPTLTNILGNRFFANGMKKIIAATKTQVDQDSLRQSVEKYTGLRLEEAATEDYSAGIDRQVPSLIEAAASQKGVTTEISTLQHDQARISQQAPIIIPLIQSYRRFAGHRQQHAAI